ncbi:multicopper oxidase domain-containing protein [Candidatus Nitrosopelagicus sp.]|nr:multicopper oxidase domain-containing protein [Candidatus Nitrosopelagicus sp.]MDC0171835.1 multicopper oxidase domain-containing protein [Candidatus Nitrosopelagicus sp.]MDC0203271.1 multicopper oxidase domain-containing protein [Candidatus Nitrosopelagicus sp.]
MNRRISTIMTVAAIAVMGGALFGSSITAPLNSGTTMEVETSPLAQVAAMGGLELVMPEAYASGPCGDLLNSGRPVVNFDLTGESVDLPTMTGSTYSAMTFSGQVPGPTLRVTQGDVVHMTLTIPGDEVTQHGNDMHASQMSSKPYMGAVKIGETGEYCFVAEVPGVFKYHCSGVDLAAMDQHVLSGMYGITIVDPLDGYKRLMVEKTALEGGEVVKDKQFYDADALEFQLQYNQLYLTDAGTYDMGKMMSHSTSQTVVNGQAFGYVPNGIHNLLMFGDANKNIFLAQPWNSMDLKQYQSQLLFIPTDEHVRIFIENQGNEPVFWHVVGEIVDRVTQGNRVQAQGTETWLLGGSQNMIVDIVFDEPGVYAAVNHDYAAIYSGAATIFVAGLPLDPVNETATALGVVQGAVDAGSYAGVLGNPHDAVPPAGLNTISHPALNVHCMCTDDVANAAIENGALPLWEVIPAVIAAAQG